MSPLVAVLLTNLLPVVSVVGFGWSAFTLVLLYWIENLIIGVLNAVKILIAGFTAGRAGVLWALAITPLFIFAYGLLCLVHGLFIYVLFGPGFGLNGGPSGEPPDPITFVLSHLHSDRALFWNVVVLLVFHVLNFLRYWVYEARWRTIDPFTQMFAPYPRILVVHLTLIVTGIPVVLLGQPVLAVLFLALLKTGLETGQLHLFDAFADNPAIAVRLRRRLGALSRHARH